MTLNAPAVAGNPGPASTGLVNLVPVQYDISTGELVIQGTEWALGSLGAIGSGRATVALSAGATNNLSPLSAWPGIGLTQYGRLILTAPSGTANVTGLLAGNDNQWCLIVNNDPTNNVTLNSLNAGSSAANRFSYVADLILPPGGSVIGVYDATFATWILT